MAQPQLCRSETKRRGGNLPLRCTRRLCQALIAPGFRSDLAHDDMARRPEFS